MAGRRCEGAARATRTVDDGLPLDCISISSRRRSLRTVPKLGKGFVRLMMVVMLANFSLRPHRVVVVKNWLSQLTKIVCHALGTATIVKDGEVALDNGAKLSAKDHVVSLIVADKLVL